MFARRIGLFIEKKELEEAGVLADFMANIVEASLEEKLSVLSALGVKDRLEKVNELLARQVQGIKRNTKITTITSEYYFHSSTTYPISMEKGYKI